MHHSNIQSPNGQTGLPRPPIRGPPTATDFYNFCTTVLQYENYKAENTLQDTDMVQPIEVVKEEPRSSHQVNHVAMETASESVTTSASALADDGWNRRNVPPPPPPPPPPPSIEQGFLYNGFQRPPPPRPRTPTESSVNAAKRRRTRL